MKKELKGKVSILVNRDYTTIEIEDCNSSITFAKIKLTPEQLSAALSRQVCIECELEVKSLDRVGKKHENKTLVFELPEGIKKFPIDESKLQEIAQSNLSDGWIAESYFGSQNSFFKKEGKEYARCTIRRWI